MLTGQAFIAGSRLILSLVCIVTLLLPGAVGADEPGEAPLRSAAQAGQRVPQIIVPYGFAATLLLQLPENRQPTSIAYGPDGALYIAVLAGEIYRLTDDGQLNVFAGPYSFPLGLAWRGNELYFTSLSKKGERPPPVNGQCGAEEQRGRVGILRDTNGDGRADQERIIIDDLPVGLAARHMVNGIAFGLDGKLYVTNGSCENRRRTTDDPRRGTVQRYNPDGTIPADNPDPRSPVIATGMRNIYDVAIHPVDGSVFISENGRDDMGDDLPPEELNHIIFGPGQPIRHYGWPECYGNNGGRECDGTQPPVAELEVHASANGLTFYTGEQFGPEYKHDIFIAYYGAGNPDRRPFGHTVARVQLTRVGDTYTGRETIFAAGLARPLDVIESKDGGLIVADFGQIGGTGAIYRIDRVADANPFASVPPPTAENAPVFIPATGHSVAADFYNFWQKYGGLEMFGYPLSQEFMEDGRLVQYFERARFERAISVRCPTPPISSPECQEFRVHLGLLGRNLAAGRESEPAFAPIGGSPDTADRRFFPETGHSLSGGFKRYWDEHGGVRVIGFPISEEFTERNSDTGQEYTVQYFERARFEYHPELAGTPYEILQGRLGAQIAGMLYP